MDQVRTCREVEASAHRVGELFAQHAETLVRYVSSRVGIDAAEDVVSETFVVALRGVDGYDPALGGARSWLFGIATNVMRNHVRGELRRRRLGEIVRELDAGPDEAARTDDRLDAARRVRGLADAIDRLDDGDREVLLLTALGGLRAAEVASVLAIPAGTVRSRLHRARRVLRHATTVPAHDDTPQEEGHRHARI